ncbi:MAG TPA: carbon-nitrogen hydrolase family protein [Spirochaetota bacterium]|nr:carbon-nitrogen hydrolase family protein [Spirochaetota bacterium]OPZ36219.1 MAG: (R)-stereoselective amidase [Spirochaetes bacterium ADurb.BinA120]HNU92340.1 carbon-nitrogen hydrolase family protein [Spirochaetota bacterium]HPI14705.1 carbon-nitrogen hydrolase family protein [Spirochaetota bacterium]HPV98587.1 carbon-nitrogen hydrolase family protein [Spirochaetota bacterium]
MKNVRIVLCQMPLGERINRNQASSIRAFNPHFVCFPEYFFVNKRLGNHGQTAHNQKRQLDRIRLMSRSFDATVIGGTMPELSGELLHNTSFIYSRGKSLGFYRKRNLFFAEEGKITPGDRFSVFSAHGMTFGVLICADVFKDESFLEMRRLGARIIFIPTFSLRREESVEDKYRRDEEIFVRGAKLAEALVVKVCGVKSDYKDFLQARSLVASPEGVLYRVKPEEEDSTMLIRFEAKL